MSKPENLTKVKIDATTILNNLYELYPEYKGNDEILRKAIINGNTHVNENTLEVDELVKMYKHRYKFVLKNEKLKNPI